MLSGSLLATLDLPPIDRSLPETRNDLPVGGLAILNAPPLACFLTTPDALPVARSLSTRNDPPVTGMAILNAPPVSCPLEAYPKALSVTGSLPAMWNDLPVAALANLNAPPLSRRLQATQKALSVASFRSAVRKTSLVTHHSRATSKASSVADFLLTILNAPPVTDRF
jgi:hypothetical protein